MKQATAYFFFPGYLMMKNMTFLFGLLLLIAAAVPAPSHAQTPTQILSECMVSETTGRDRVDFARWLGLVILAHPSFGKTVTVSSNARAQADQRVADLFTDLLVRRCGDETRAAFQAEGSHALEVAGELLGRVAMEELMRNPAVDEAAAAFLEYIDDSQFESVFE